MRRRRRLRSTAHSLRSLFVLPMVLVILLFINWMTFSGEWWVRWAALGLGIAWIIHFFRVLCAVLLVGGLAGLAALLAGRR